VTFASVGGAPVRIEAHPGKHAVLVKTGNGVLLGESVTLEAGTALKLKVRKVRARDVVLMLENLPAGAVVEVDGGRVAVALTAGKPLKIDDEPGRHVVVVKLGNDLLLGESVTMESGRELKLRVPAKETAEKQPSALASAAAPGPDQQRSAVWTSPSTKMAFVRIKGGEFMMGSPDGDDDANDDEKPQHKVQISPFLLGVTEVTRGQFRVFVDDTGYKTEAEKVPAEIGVGPRSSDEAPRALKDRDRSPIETIRQPHRSELGEQVERAIREGIRFLNANQRDDGSWSDDIENKAPTGMTSRVTLALLTAGEKPDSPAIRKALEFLRRFGPGDLHSTYAISLQTMVFAQAEPERDQLRIAANVRWREQAQIKPNEPVSGPGSWTYSDSKPVRGDNSNSQYALLGLDAASEAGVPVKPEVWALAGDYWETGPRAEQALGVLVRRLVGSGSRAGDQLRPAFPGKGRAPVLINKLRHGPAGDWQNDPDDVRNLVNFVSRDWKGLLTWQVVDPGIASVSELLQAPIIFFNGHHVPEFNAIAKQSLREFIEQGGFIRLGCHADRSPTGSTPGKTSPMRCRH